MIPLNSSLMRSFSYSKPTVLDKLDAHCLDKRAYLFRLHRRLEPGDWIRFPAAVSKARPVGSRTRKTHIHTRDVGVCGVCVVE